MITKEQYFYLRQLDDFKYLTIEQFDNIVNKIQYRTALKNHTLFFEGDHREKLFLIQSGYAKIEQTDASGSFIYTDYVRQDTIFPYGGLFFDDVYHFSAVAITDVGYFSLPMEVYETHALQNINQMKHLCRKYSKLLNVHEIKLRNMVTSSARMRVVQTLATLLLEVTTEEGRLPFPITTIEIANMSATTRETVSHVLKELRQKDIVELKYKTLFYNDKQYFKKFIE
ncbi:Crp/Fnr family transcriptional regulator [Streptococcus halotolerans]|uniref:Crp/Fnr family transcriptional regulator n=1 Tax=Streptococcus halotolerans TaxID=1814128 RepID=UPI0007877DEC|nr:Crp/Fnr family transcriptional regulator [Streptococcus halotolerans]